jgi:hypothetical protein
MRQVSEFLLFSRVPTQGRLIYLEGSHVGGEARHHLPGLTYLPRAQNSLKALRISRLVAYTIGLQYCCSKGISVSRQNGLYSNLSQPQV